MGELEEVIADLRAVLISRKEPATVHLLNRDYKELHGTDVPYKKFNFTNLEQFLRSDPTFLFNTKGKDVYVSVVPKKESRHISEMIAKQKSNKKKSHAVRQPRALNTNPMINVQAKSPGRNYSANMRMNRTSRSAQLFYKKSPASARFKPRQSSYNSPEQNIIQHGLQNQPQPSMQSIISQSQHQALPKSNPPRHTMKIIQSHLQPQVKQSMPSQMMKENTASNTPNIQVASKNYQSNKQATQRNLPSSKTNLPPTKSEVLDKLLECKQIRMPKAAPNQKENTVATAQNKTSDNKHSDNPLQENKRSILNLEPVPKITRNVSLSSANGNENIQVTMCTNGNMLPTFSAQDRLSRIRQMQNQNKVQSTTASTSDNNLVEKYPPLPMGKVSQQSRLLKYKNPEAVTKIDVCENKQSSQPDEVVNSDDSDFDKNLNYEELLMDYCNEKNIALPNIKILQHKIHKDYRSDRPSEIYGCNVKIGDQYCFGSYSYSFNNPEDASRDACRKALHALTKIYGSLEERDLPVTEGTLIPNRFLKLIAGHSNGKFVHQLPGEYREEYRENLPEDWLDFVKMSHIFQIEDSVAGSQIISLRTQDELTECKKDDGDFADLPPIVLPERDSYWNVYITTLCSTIEVWCRIIGPQYATLFDELSSYMEKELATKKTQAEAVSVGGYYAVCTSESWYRIQVLEIQDNKALCFYIDTGEEDWHLKSDIFTLDPKYRYVPAQAVLLQLADLEDYAENKNVLKYLNEYILYKSLVAEVLADENAEDQILSVVLFDTSTEEDVNLNDLIRKKMKEEEKAPRLNEKGRINDKIHVSHICNNGDIYIQIRNDTFKYLHSQIQFITDIGFSNADILDSAKLLQESPLNNLYLAVKPEENKCYRVKATGPIKRGEVPVYFVDYGYTECIPVSKMIALEKVSSVINEFPHQAIKVQLYGLENFTPSLASRLRGCLPINGSVLLKVIEYKNVPIVEIFMRTQDQLLISVNNALQNELEIEKNAVEVEQRDHIKKRMEGLSIKYNSPARKPLPQSPQRKTLNIKALPEPTIIAGSHFPVIVTMAASPSNFVVQPFTDDGYRDFKRLMKDLQVLCNSSPFSNPSYEEIEKGNLYAGKHTDGVWYRVQVTNVMRNNSVTVHFCDYGDYNVMSYKNLQRLTPPFLKMPYNALRARLGGETPIIADWSVEECLRFQERVCDKVFVAKINSIDADELNASDKIISLTLIDTTSENDVYITPEYVRTYIK